MNRCLRDERDESILPIGMIVGNDGTVTDGGQRVSSIRHHQRNSLDRSSSIHLTAPIKEARRGSVMDAYFAPVFVRYLSLIHEIPPSFF